MTQPIPPTNYDPEERYVTDPRDTDTLTDATPLHDEEQTGLPEAVEVPEDEEDGDVEPINEANDAPEQLQFDLPDGDEPETGGEG
jgi:hypothetical protein